jgi:hypothetical protein
VDLVALVSDAMRACAPETNRKAWIARLATETDRSERCIEAAFYGEGGCDADTLWRLSKVLGTRFHNIVYGPAGLTAFRTGTAEAAASEDMRRHKLFVQRVKAALADLEAGK